MKVNGSNGLNNQVAFKGNLSEQIKVIGKAVGQAVELPKQEEKTMKRMVEAYQQSGMFPERAKSFKQILKTFILPGAKVVKDDLNKAGERVVQVVSATGKNSATAPAKMLDIAGTAEKAQAAAKAEKTVDLWG